MSTESGYADAPFDHPKADIILRSCDGVDFRVFKLFLSLVSPFFDALFSIPQPAKADPGDETKYGLAVIPVTETSKTLDIILRFCYPSILAEDPQLEILGGLANVLEAARKYSFDAIERKAIDAFSNTQIIEAEPMRCFAVARRGRVREATLLAAKHTLSHPIIPPSFQEIDMITAADLLVLLTYHRACGDAVYALKNDQSWIISHFESANEWPLGHEPRCELCKSVKKSRSSYHSHSRPNISVTIHPNGGWTS